jgi:hypothetical protein
MEALLQDSGPLPNAQAKKGKQAAGQSLETHPAQKQ